MKARDWWIIVAFLVVIAALLPQEPHSISDWLKARQPIWDVMTAFGTVGAVLVALYGQRVPAPQFSISLDFVEGSLRVTAVNTGRIRAVVSWFFVRGIGSIEPQAFGTGAQLLFINVGLPIAVDQAHSLSSFESLAKIYEKIELTQRDRPDPAPAENLVRQLRFGVQLTTGECFEASPSVDMRKSMMEHMISRKQQKTAYQRAFFQSDGTTII